MREPAGRQHALDFARDAFGPFDVFEHRVALDALEDVRREGKGVGAGADVHAGRHDDVEIHVAVGRSPSAAQVEVPAPQRRIDFQLLRIVENRRRRRKQPVKAVSKPGGVPTLVQKLDTLGTHKVA